MKQLLRWLGIGYIVYALLVGYFATRTILRGYDTLSAAAAPAIQWVPLFTFIGIAVVVAAMMCSLAYFLIKRRCRKTALVFAAISCIGIPVGTILGVLTLFTLTRAEIKDEFARSHVAI